MQILSENFSKKMGGTHCQFKKSIYFCTPFQSERDGEKKPTVLSHVAGITQLVE